MVGSKKRHRFNCTQRTLFPSNSTYLHTISFRSTYKVGARRSAFVADRFRLTANRSRTAFSCRRRSFSAVSGDSSTVVGFSASRINVRSFSNASAMFICCERVSSLFMIR